MIQGLLLTPLAIVGHPKGDIYHAIKASSAGFNGFGEAYFSTVNKGCIKGWKRHNRLALNVVVPVGGIRFVIYDDRKGSASQGEFNDIFLGKDFNYSRITIPPALWVSFHGLSEINLLMNLIAEEHDPSESENIPLEEISYTW